jgi:hypothetical protein
VAPFIGNFPTPPPALPPFDPISIIFDIIGLVTQLLGGGGPDIAGLSYSINSVWGNLVMTSGFLYNAVRSITEFFKAVIVTIVTGLGHIISDVLHGHLLQMIKDIQALFHALHALFAPLLAWLKKLQAIQRQYQLQTMRRVINLIQRARQVLVLFKLLHLKWATKLDNFLAGVEGKIIAREFDIVRKTNELIGWINLITDPFGTLRTAPVFAPLGQTLRALLGALKAVDAQALFPGLTQVWTPVPAGPGGPLPQLPGPAHPPPQTP